MNFSRKIILTLILLLLIPGFTGLSASTDLRSWEFNAPEEIKGWRGEGVEGSRVQEGVFQIMGREQVQLISPSNLDIPIQPDPYLRIRYLFHSPRYLQVFWQPRSGKPVLLPDVIQPLFDRNFHTSWIPLTDKLEYRDTIEQLGLIFGGRPGWVEIDSIEVLPFSLGRYLQDQWREFMNPRRLHPGMINSLNSPALFDQSFISWCNKLALFVLVIGAIIYFRTKNNRIRIAAMAGLAILVIWMIYDIRETYSQFQVAEEIHRTYIKPPAGEKTYPSLSDFYQLVSLVDNNIPSDAQYHFYQEWPYDCRLKYFVYPRRINCDASSNIISSLPIPYHLIYRNPQIQYDAVSRRLRYQDLNTGMEFYISNPGVITGWIDPGSYIFRED